MEKQSQLFRVAGIILAYVITIVGLLSIPWVFALAKSWVLGFLLFIVIIPVFPVIQTFLLGERPASVVTFAKVYVGEYASLTMQMIFLLFSVPMIVIAVAGRLAIAMLVTAVIAWPIVALQQLGFNIGAKMPLADIKILFWVTVGLGCAVGLYFLLHWGVKRYELEDRYFTVWADQFKKIHNFFQY